MTTLDALLQPISPDHPCGEDMVFSTEFDAIRDARRHDDASLDQGEWVTDIKEADWPFVAKSCTALLSTRTKDIRLAAWLTEAWAKTRGFSGLRDGFRLVTGLCEQYWDGLYPLPDDDDVQQRVGNLSWLLARSAQLMRELPLTRSDGASYGAALWDSASQLANAIKRTPDNAHELSRGKLTMEQFDAARRDTPPAFYIELQGNLEECLQALNDMEASLSLRLGNDGPSFTPARTSLQGVIELAERFARDAGLITRADTRHAAPLPEPIAETTMTPAAPPSPAASVPAAPYVPGGPLQTREQALAQLREVADFFRRTEPHSPVAYLAEKAAGWGEMSLHLWLRTVLKEGDSLANLEELLGIPKSGDGNQTGG